MLPIELITSHVLFAVVQSSQTPSPTDVEAKEPPVPVVVTEAPNWMLCVAS
jgi:hypothetical protein